MRHEAANPARKIVVIVVTAYVFISEFHWLYFEAPKQMDLNFLATSTFLFRALLFSALVLSLIGRLAEHYELYLHSGTVADDIKFHFLRDALEFILLIYIIIKIIYAFIN